MAAALLALFALLGALLFDPVAVRESLPEAFAQSGRKVPSAAEMDAMVSGMRALQWILTFVWLGCTYSFWRGRKWARAVVMAGSALTLFNVFSLGSQHSPIATAFLVLDVVFSGYLLYWLAQPPIARYFQRPRE